MNSRALIFVFFFWAISTLLCAQERIDLSDGIIIVPENLNRQRDEAVRMLVEETSVRTSVVLKPVHPGAEIKNKAIIICDKSEWKNISAKYKLPYYASDNEFNAPEGYILRTVDSDNRMLVCVIANDDRGFLFGIGRLLRLMEMEKGKITIDANINIRTAPQYQLRGHQIGYRPKPNSYDGWTPAMMEQYIRELAIFGTNAIELIPPKSDDTPASPHFPVPQSEMMTIMSGICDRYGLGVWVWYPALEKDYTDDETIKRSLDEWSAVFRSMPRLDAVFVPCGDPGTTPPDILFRLIEKQAEQLKQIHPSATWWIAPQGFDVERLDTFHKLICSNPVWLKGIVYGPWTRMPLPEFRKWIPANYPIRHYPDITHSSYCQYPVPDWDPALSLVYGREPIAPRPDDMTTIFRLLQPYTVGFIAYSEGCNDDVNKIIWSCLGWDSKTNPSDILREYSRFFMGPVYEEFIKDAILKIEKNWKGPLATNSNVDSTLKYLQVLEKNASPPLLLNWRFQQLLFRAYYDAYVKRKLILETELEKHALEVLRSAGKKEADIKAQKTIEILNTSYFDPEIINLRTRTFALGEALYQSIRMQLHTGLYRAGRPDGAVLDRIDTPLNNREWITDMLRKAMAEKDARRKIDIINQIFNWKNPGEGGFYDNLGVSDEQSHLVRTKYYSEDPAFLASPLMATRTASKQMPLSWKSHAKGLYDIPITLKYEGLDPKASYMVKAVYANGPVMLKANGKTIHELMNKPFEILEFEIPRELTSEGTLVLEWFRSPGEGHGGWGNELCEVWLIKNKNYKNEKQINLR